MKTIGLLGGMSWIATVPYYTRLNELVAQQVGDANSARILLYSVNYARLKSLYHHGWNQIPEIFEQEYKCLLDAKPDCIILACNTMHKAFDIIVNRLPNNVPFFHAVHLTKDFCVNRGIKKPLFIGTAFTMRDDYFMRPLIDAGINLTLPTESEQKKVQEVQTDVSKGIVNDEQKVFFAELINNYPKVDGVILACTELPLIAPVSSPARPIINPAELQCQAAVKFALAEN